MLADPEVIEALATRTVPYRLLLGHRIDAGHVTFFPDALKIGDALGVRSDPAFVLVGRGGVVAWKHVGLITKDALLAALRSSNEGAPAARPRQRP